ncbi:MAG: polysaccharide biosynthesis tyrosine autokinase [Gemmataceae bacterium]
MARSNNGENPPTGPLQPYNTAPGGMLAPTGGPYGPSVTIPGATGKTPPTPLGLLNALRRRWVLATFLGLLVGAALGTGLWFLLPGGKHTARATVQLRPSTVETGKGQVEDFDSFRRSQMYLVKSRDLINRTIAEPKVASLQTIRESDDPVQLLETGVRVDGSVAPDLMQVSFSGNNRDDLVKIVDALVGKYVDDANNAVRKNLMDKADRLEKLIGDLRAKVEQDEREIKRKAEFNGTIGIEDTNKQLSTLKLMETQLSQETAALKTINQDNELLLEKVKEKIEQAKTDKTKLVADTLMLREWVAKHPRVDTLVKQKLAREIDLGQAKTAAGTVPDAPVVLALDAEVKLLQKAIDKARAEVLPDIRAALQEYGEEMLKAKHAELLEQLTLDRARLERKERTLTELTKNAGNIAKTGFDIQSLTRGLEPMKKRLDTLEDQKIQIVIERGMESRVGVREAAVLILNENLKQKIMLAGAVGVAGFLGVLFLIALLEWRNRRVDGVDQVVTELGMRVIGTVPAFPNRASLKAAEAAGNANWRFILNESINSTRTMLLHTARSQSMQVVMVTSATQGEGKTSLSSQLASSMATAGMRTLIVDCDLRNPSIHKLFDLPLTPGVSEVLCQEVDPSDAVQPTAVPNLWVIPAGQCSTRVIAALAQGHPLETLFNRLRGQFDFVVVDSCPVLPVADALLIGQHVDGVVFSIMQDISQLPKVMVASEKLHQLSINLLGAVVNGVHMGSAYYAYGYNYVKQLPA